MIGQLLDIVGQAIQLPLPIHLGATPPREAIQPFVVAQVTEHRLHRGKTPGNHLATQLRVDLRLHPVGVTFVSLAFALEERYLPGLRLLGRAQTLDSECAWHAIALGAAELYRGIAVEGAVRTVRVEPLAGRAGAVRAVRGPAAVSRPETLARLLLRALVPERVGRFLVLSLPGIARNRAADSRCRR
jgi:hypothetical protein